MIPKIVKEIESRKQLKEIVQKKKDHAFLKVKATIAMTSVLK